MLVKHSLVDPEESPRKQKKPSPTVSSDTSSPYFSAPPTSPIMPNPLPSYPPLDPVSYAGSDADNSNYTTTAMTTAPSTFGEMQKMAELSNPAEEHILSVTPVKSVAEIANGTDMLEFSPGSMSSSTATTGSENSCNEGTPLPSMSKRAREEVYRYNFNGKDPVELHSMQIPTVCNDYPELADEIFQAYLYYTCFNVKVWANYDSVIEELYDHEERLKSCGKLVLSPMRYNQLANLDPSIFQVKNLRLNIGTPFRTLYEMHIGVKKASDSYSQWDLKVEYQRVPNLKSPHNILEHVMSSARKNITEDGVRDGQAGLAFAELEAIALEFRYKPKNVVKGTANSLFGGSNGLGSMTRYVNPNKYSTATNGYGTSNMLFGQRLNCFEGHGG